MPFSCDGAKPGPVLGFIFATEVKSLAVLDFAQELKPRSFDSIACFAAILESCDEMFLLFIGRKDLSLSQRNEKLAKFLHRKAIYWVKARYGMVRRPPAFSSGAI